ncbi:MAG: DUF192 domain-containing protein [Acidimicrobiales bacterium]
MAWLLRGGEVLAALEVADGFAGRSRGLLGRDGIEGAILIKPARSVHTVGMRFPIDVAFCDRDMTVVDAITMARFRVSRPRLRARCVVEAEAGAFERWGLRPGDRLEIKGDG